MYGFQLWLPQIISATAHGDDAQTALLSAIPAVFQALGMVLIARNSDRTGERRWHLATSASLAVAGLVTPLVAALAMSGSSILVTMNALRARSTRGGTR